MIFEVVKDIIQNTEYIFEEKNVKSSENWSNKRGTCPNKW